MDVLDLKEKGKLRTAACGRQLFKQEEVERQVSQGKAETKGNRREEEGDSSKRGCAGFRLRWDWDTAEERHRHCDSALLWSRARASTCNWKH